MIGVYFSGTGNTKYCVEKFLAEYYHSKNIGSIEDPYTAEKIKKNHEMVIGYPVQYSAVPKILRDYIMANPDIWKGKKVFIIATMGLFSGDGAGILARLLNSYGAVITGGLHLKMPDSIGDVRALKRSPEKNKELVMKAEEKIQRAVYFIKSGKPPQEGLGIGCHLAGLFGQRLYFGWKTKRYTNKLKIDPQKCIGCGLCKSLCPMENISIKKKLAVSGDQCTMCYRCISRCPKQAITLLGKRVIDQNDIHKLMHKTSYFVTYF